MASDPQREFLFLNQSLSSKPRSQREKELQDADRRAHAARNSRLKRPVQQAEDEATSMESRSSKRPNPRPVEDVEQDGDGPALPFVNQQLAVRPKTPEHPQTMLGPSLVPKTLTSTILLGQGNHDPFDTASVSGLPPFIYDMLDHEFYGSVGVADSRAIFQAYRVVWPTVMNQDPKDTPQYMAIRRRVARETPFILHAQIVNAAWQRLRLLPAGHQSRSLIAQAAAYHERKALETVADMLQKLPTPPWEGIVVALLLVTWPAGTHAEGPSKYPVSPMATAQNLHLFNNMELTPGRIQQIRRFYHILEPLGGLDGLSAPDHLHTFSIADTFVSSRLGVRPLWPWPNKLHYAFDAFDDLVLDTPAFQLSLVLGRGFSCLKDARLVRLLMMACRTTLGIDLYQRKSPAAPSLRDISTVRNAVQHQLCSLDPPSELVPTHDDLLYNMVRLAALIYSDLVLFPIGESVNLKSQLAYDLRKALELSFTGETRETQAERELILWCLTMGTMASHGTVHQEWYVVQLGRNLREDRRLLDWILFQTLMSHFLWWDYVLQPRCWDVWNEAAQPVRVEELSSAPSEKREDDP
ncbi:uncharacterized protein Z520_10722 [Fonsecaea multimorphosa CBS 102226]|uniref:Transcription factor domain-containing protein n=1 Tax=Fonsecaea multimorphosa CBS 102226 TaxID=1442371 RepID=A0A0D2JST5_9EURO|nr:uncharacterized protein Z520_10722 [Fonsecaea multimorphosa CBS 102226]KIX93544.1 hypothetical protein Z520_10722 [Fonsecaea multimorphosa CBS 102226]OAL18859.1 hypothetical protein AYO22_10188 [Fonsecaea multimorphosa]